MKSPLQYALLGTIILLSACSEKSPRVRPTPSNPEPAVEAPVSPDGDQVGPISSVPASPLPHRDPAPEEGGMTETWVSDCELQSGGLRYVKERVTFVPRGELQGEMHSWSETYLTADCTGLYSMVDVQARYQIINDDGELRVKNHSETLSFHQDSAVKEARGTNACEQNHWKIHQPLEVINTSCGSRAKAYKAVAAFAPGVMVLKTCQSELDSSECIARSYRRVEER